MCQAYTPHARMHTPHARTHHMHAHTHTPYTLVMVTIWFKEPALLRERGESAPDCEPFSLKIYNVCNAQSEWYEGLHATSAPCMLCMCAVARCSSMQVATNNVLDKAHAIKQAARGSPAIDTLSQLRHYVCRLKFFAKLLFIFKYYSPPWASRNVLISPPPPSDCFNGPAVDKLRRFSLVSNLVYLFQGPCTRYISYIVQKDVLYQILAKS